MPIRDRSAGRRGEIRRPCGGGEHKFQTVEPGDHRSLLGKICASAWMEALLAPPFSGWWRGGLPPVPVDGQGNCGAAVMAQIRAIMLDLTN